MSNQNNNTKQTNENNCTLGLTIFKLKRIVKKKNERKQNDEPPTNKRLNNGQLKADKNNSRTI